MRLKPMIVLVGIVWMLGILNSLLHAATSLFLWNGSRCFARNLHMYVQVDRHWAMRVMGSGFSSVSEYEMWFPHLPMIQR